MHATLTKGINFLVALLWALLLAAMLLTTRPVPMTEVSFGLLVGALAGFLQFKAITSSPDTFVAAKTALDVRRALMAVRSGKYSIVLLWVNGLGLFIWAMAFAPNMFLGAWVAGVAAFGLAREVAAFPAIVRLGRLLKAAAPHGT